MKIKVLLPFGDHKEGVIRQAGDVIEVTKTRLAEIAKGVPAHFFEEVKAGKAEKEESED